MMDFLFPVRGTDFDRTCFFQNRLAPDVIHLVLLEQKLDPSGVLVRDIP